MSVNTFVFIHRNIHFTGLKRNVNNNTQPISKIVINTFVSAQRQHRKYSTIEWKGLPTFLKPFLSNLELKRCSAERKKN